MERIAGQRIVLRRARHAVLSTLCLLALPALLFLPARARGTAAAPPAMLPAATSTPAPPPAARAYPIVVHYGQSDREAVALLPDMDLRTMTATDAPPERPVLVFTSDVDELPATRGSASSVDSATLVHGARFPDALLLFSHGWYGEKLRQAAERMGLKLSRDQLGVVEAMAVARGVNTRLLLTIAAVKQAGTQFSTPLAWRKWLYLETGRVRAALGPFKRDHSPAMRFHDGATVSLAPATANTAAWALVTVFGAGRTRAETWGALHAFRATYARTFGDPAVDEAGDVAAQPFLYKPYHVALTGNGYYDHTYPSVDNGGDPNIPGMLDYLGRATTNYDTHDANDFWMPYGSDVFAPIAGPVLWNDDTSILIGYAANTYEIYIGHLSQRFVGTGASVTAGQLVGKSGVANALEHIHFEVRHNGKQTDTMGWYGGGSDPCPAGPTAFDRYKGCEASVWLWADESPPDPPTIWPIYLPLVQQGSTATSTRP